MQTHQLRRITWAGLYLEIAATTPTRSGRESTSRHHVRSLWESWWRCVNWSTVQANPYNNCFAGVVLFPKLGLAIQTLSQGDTETNNPHTNTSSQITVHLQHRILAFYPNQTCTHLYWLVHWALSRHPFSRFCLGYRLILWMSACFFKTYVIPWP